MARSVLLTGSPGIGKTTIIRKVIDALGERAGGFYTQEISGPGGRHGFELVTLGGDSVTLAHKDFSAARYPRVGRYGVDVEALERVGVRALERAIKQGKLIIVDEIGMMELYSRRFLDVVMGAVLGSANVLGSITARRHPEADAFRFIAQVEIWEVDRRNRDRMHDRLLAWVNKLERS